jgi:gliding motility-associated-like protein
MKPLLFTVIILFACLTAFSQKKDLYVFDGSYPDIEIPEGMMVSFCNCFTPDGNSIRDCYRPALNGITASDDYSFTVFNRWGNVVFETTDFDACWDGSIAGNEKNGALINREIKSGTYVWKIVFTHPTTGKKEDFIGHINVLAGNES